jgi:hypothetical protein
MPKVTHLIPDGDSADDHTTACRCTPARVELKSGIFRTEIVVFHQKIMAEED